MTPPMKPARHTSHLAKTLTSSLAAAAILLALPGNAPAQGSAGGSNPPTVVYWGGQTTGAENQIYPADDSGLLLKNGNFSTPNLDDPYATTNGKPGGKGWHTFPGIKDWTAISGELVELQKGLLRVADRNPYAGGQYCEIDAHRNPGYQGPSDHGIEQTARLIPGRYTLVFDYHDRYRNGIDIAHSFVVKAKLDGGQTFMLATKKGNTADKWMRHYVDFELKGGEPNKEIAVKFQFDIGVGDKPDTFGVFLDNIMLIPDRRIMLRVDRDYSGKFDTERNLFQSADPKGLVIDVNNIKLKPNAAPENKDSTLPVSQINSDLQYAQDRRAETLKVNLPQGDQRPDVKLRIRNPDKPLEGGSFPNDYAVENGRIRIFTSDLTPKMAIAPNATVYPLTDSEKDLAAVAALDPKKPAPGRSFWIEGTEPGEVIIDLECIPFGKTKPIVKRVRIEVNVDGLPGDPTKGTHKNGLARNRVNALNRYTKILRGVSANFTGSMEPLLTWHKTPRTQAYASTWIGFTTDPFDTTFLLNKNNPGSLVQRKSRAWAQGGLFAWNPNARSNAQGALPYAEIVVDFTRYIEAGADPLFYTKVGALNRLPYQNERKWWNMPFTIMYVKGQSIGNDTIFVETKGFGITDKPGATEIHKRKEDHKQGLFLNTRKYIQFEASFESSQSTARMPGIPDHPSRIRQIQVAFGETAGVIENKVPTPKNFNPIILDKNNLQIIAVNNDGLEVLRGNNYSHFRIDLDGADTVLLWDKYKWMSPGTGDTMFSPPEYSNPASLW